MEETTGIAKLARAATSYITNGAMKIVLLENFGANTNAIVISKFMLY